MTGQLAFGQAPRRLIFPLILLLLALAQTAGAHRPDESYLYIVVDEGPLSGQFHIRVSDMAKAVPLDLNEDGQITDAEVEQSFAAITAYLAERVKLHDGSGSYIPVFEDLRFFGKPQRRQMVLDFVVPSINPPPDVLDAEFRFLYDGIDPIHRPMLLVKSNTRMRLAYNESHVSLEFETGADRQSISLVPPPFGARVTGTLQQGFLLILNNPFHLLIALTALLGSLRWYAQTAPDEQSTGGLAKNVSYVSILLGVGFATGLLVQEYFPFRVSGHDAKNFLAAAFGAAAVANLVAQRPIPRAIALVLAGGLCGVTMLGFGAVVGLNKGYLEIVYPGLVIGVFAACCLLAAVLLPLGFVLLRQSAWMEKGIRIGSGALVVVSALFLFQRLVIL